MHDLKMTDRIAGGKIQYEILQLTTGNVIYLILFLC